MPTPKPYAGTSLDRLVGLINSDNESVLALDVDFTISAPQELFHPGGRNSVVTLTPVPGTKYKGPQSVFYRRLGIDAIGRLPANFVKNVIINELPFSIHGILGDINEALGVDLSEDEVTDETFALKQDTYPLNVKQDGSYAWVNSSYNFKVNWPEDDIDLGVAISVGQLNGLVYIQP